MLPNHRTDPDRLPPAERTPRTYAGDMNKSTLWTIVGVVVAVIIAWTLVSVLFSLLWFIAKLALVAIVAVVVFLVLRGVFSGRE